MRADRSDASEGQLGRAISKWGMRYFWRQHATEDQEALEIEQVFLGRSHATSDGRRCHLWFQVLRDNGGRFQVLRGNRSWFQVLRENGSSLHPPVKVVVSRKV